RWCWRSARPEQRDIVHPHPGGVPRRVKPVLVQQEVDTHGLCRIRAHVHYLVGPVHSITHMEDRLQDVTIAIGDISILPVERDAVISAVLVPEAQCGASRYWPELLIERAVSKWFVIILLAICILLWVAACECGKSPGVRKIGGDYRIVGVAINHPGWEAAGLESFVLD